MQYIIVAWNVRHIVRGSILERELASDREQDFINGRTFGPFEDEEAAIDYAKRHIAFTRWHTFPLEKADGKIWWTDAGGIVSTDGASVQHGP